MQVLLIANALEACAKQSKCSSQLWGHKEQHTASLAPFAFLRSNQASYFHFNEKRGTMMSDTF